MVHNVPQLTKDVQVLSENSLMIFVTGQLQIGGQSQPLLFAQTFQLIANTAGSYYINNDFFRLIYA